MKFFVSTTKGNIYRYDEKNKLDYMFHSGLPDLMTVVSSQTGALKLALDVINGVFPIKLNQEINKDEMDLIILNITPYYANYNSNNYFQCSPKEVAIKNDNEFVIAHAHGTAVLKDNIIKEITGIRSYAVNYVNDELWVGTIKGLKVFDSELNEKYNFLDSMFIKDIVSDEKYNTWIITDGKGIWKYENEKLSLIESTKNLLSNKAIIDRDNVIWLASHEGLIKMEHVDGTYKFETLNHTDGISSRNIIDINVDEKYVYALDPKRLTLLRKPHISRSIDKPLSFVSLEANGIKQNKFEFSHKLNNIEIFFKTTSYVDRDNLIYEWNLKGLDNIWRKTENTNVRFNSLPSGNYTFQIKTIDSKGQILNERNELKFKIDKAWYQTNIFYVGCFLFLLSLVYFISRQIILRSQRKAEEEARIQKEFYELQMKAVQAQMNPHFIFNALNSIQSYIYNKDPDVANEYLVDFSKLMRLILESSKKDLVPLSDEIELINLYVSLERMRFQNKFDFSFVHDPIAEIGSYTIPSNFLHPFVENAIVHGIGNKKSHAKLQIKFIIENDIFTCVIEDDGVGRDQAKRMKKERHVSRAMEILEHRQQLMDVKDNVKVNFEVHDLINSEGKPLGTKVVISIPLDIS